jgi:hypothetical protein
MCRVETEVIGELIYDMIGVEIGKIVAGKC